MKILPSIHQNHKRIPEERFWTKKKYELLKEGKLYKWTLLTARAVIKFTEETIDETNFREVLENEWPTETFKIEGAGKLKKAYQILIINALEDMHDILEKTLSEFWDELDEEKRKHPLLIFNWTDKKVLNPFGSVKFSLRNLFSKDPKKRYRLTIRTLKPEIILIKQVGQELENITEEDLQKSRIKPKKLEKWKQKLLKTKKLEETEPILGVGRLRVARNHWKVNSNFNRSGDYFFTDKRLVLIRRKFLLFGFSPTIFRPLDAFVRPANKVIIFGRIIYRYVTEPIKAVVKIRPALGSLFAGIAVYLTFLRDKFHYLSAPLIEAWRTLGQWIRQVFHVTVPDFDVAFNFVIENPEIITGFAGIFAFVRVGILKAFFRGEELVILPFEKANYLLIDRNMVFGRWKVNGCNVVGVPEGIEYKMIFHDQEMAVKFFVSALRYPSVEETEKILINNTIESISD